MHKKKLFLIGGNEDKGRNPFLLEKFYQSTAPANGGIVLISGASKYPAEVAKTYTGIFNELGCTDIIHLPLMEKVDCRDEKILSVLNEAAGIFITGGNQVKLASIMGGTPLFTELLEKVNSGTVYGGTSAGASIASTLMIAGGRGGYNPRRNLVKLSAGLGLLKNVIIDQHFRERNRLYRLASAVTSNPEYLGIGIDEDTALFIEDDRYCTIMGKNSVSILDGSHLSCSGYADGNANDVIPIMDMKLHVLTTGCDYDLSTRSAFKRAEINTPQPTI